MDERTLRVLEFAKIRDRLVGQTVTAVGRDTAAALEPSPDLDLVRLWLQETGEAIALLADGDVPLRGTSDIRDPLQRCQIGSTLEPLELLAIRDTLGTIRQCKGYVQARRDRVERLGELADHMAVFSDLEDTIRRTVADDGSVPDSASADLARIRRERRTTEARIREKLDDLLRGPSARMLQDALITTRGDRFVVPVKQEFKAQFAGVLHDQSSSGATAFMEPLAIVPLGNRMRELEIEEREEIARLLRILSGQIGERADPIGWAYDALGQIDFAVAKARLADLMHAAPPAIRTDGSLRLLQARHPLLTGDVVPIDIWLGAEFTTLVLTGPNTGGKTVTLKTVGLLAVMAQAGLFVPADPGSHTAVFPQIFADIGDEQSIEQSLSTFSSHMGAIVRILEQLDSGSDALVLLDEIGAGTDPTEGVALARAIIEHLHHRGTRTVVTTHYSELKALAYDHPGIQNASVEFDTQTLMPTYRLLIGIPGRSNALTIATRLGLRPEVVERAQSYLGVEIAAIDRILGDIEADRRAFASELAEASKARREAEDLRRRYEQDQQRLKDQRAKILARLREEAEALLARTRREVEAIVDALKATPAPDDVRAARARLRQISQDLEVQIVAAPRPIEHLEPLQHVEPGQRVLILPLNRDGIVTSAPDAHGEVEVASGTMRVQVHVSALRAAPAEEEGPAVAGSDRRHVPTREVLHTPEHVPVSIEIRGETTDEALPKLEQYVDDAYRAGYERITIVHGKGTGVLRNMVHRFLSAHPHVKDFRLGGRGEGDTGVTIVELKK